MIKHHDQNYKMLMGVIERCHNSLQYIYFCKFYFPGSPGFSGDQNDIAKLMLNLNMAAAKSTANANNEATNRRTSSEFKYRSHFQNNDDSEDDEDSEEDPDEEESEDEVIAEENGGMFSEIQRNTPRRKPAALTVDAEQIRAKFTEKDTTEGTENEADGESSGGENATRSSDPNKGNNINNDYQELEVEDIDSENLISDEEDDNESGFLSQM